MKDVMESNLFDDAAACPHTKIFGVGACKELFENAGDLIQGVDENGRFLYVNKKWRDVLGYTEEEASHMAFPDIIHQDHLQACFDAFAEMKKGKSFDNFKTQFVAKNGRIIDVSGSISVRMKDGKFLSTWGIFREAVPHTKIEDTMWQEQKFSQALIDSLPSIFYVFEVPSLRMVRWNRSMIDVFGFSNEETARMSPIDFIDEHDKRSADRLIRTIVAHGKAAAELNVHAKDGQTVPYFFSAVHIGIDDKKYIVGIGIDITDLRKREMELDRVAKKLVRRDFELLQTNDILRIRDEQIAKEHELNRAKSEFVSLASHQLKTPLTIIKWYIDMIYAGYASNSLEKEKEYLGKIYGNTERMIDLIDAFLNVSRLELGIFSIKKEPVNLRDKMELILKNFEPKIKEKNLKLLRNYAKSNFVFAADTKMIQIIFENLVSNAIKYTPPSGEIQIKMQKKGNEILIGVVDTGIGIPADQQSKIFTKFFRADNASSYKADGSGLGLYIVKTVVEKIGGKVWFRSPLTADKNGTAFYVTFYTK